MLVHCLPGVDLTEINPFLVSPPLRLPAVGFCHWPVAKPGLFGTPGSQVLLHPCALATKLPSLISELISNMGSIYRVYL